MLIHKTFNDLVKAYHTINFCIYNLTVIENQLSLKQYPSPEMVEKHLCTEQRLGITALKRKRICEVVNGLYEIINNTTKMEAKYKMFFF